MVMRHCYDVYSLLQQPTVLAFVGTPAYKQHKEDHFSAADNKNIRVIAASAHTDLTAWCKFIGELATELSFEEMPRNCVTALF
jgi:hypothetical protein